MTAFTGHLRLRAEQRGERTTLAQQSFRAPFHLSKPYWDHDARTLLVQVVNPTAGILSGDRLESEIAVDRHATLLVTTPSASRVFTMRAGAAECHQQFTVAANGWLEVALEPLVPHHGCRYRQTTRIDIAPGGGLFFVDQLMPGRLGHGEAWSWDRLTLDLEARMAGELILRERFDHTGPELKALAEFGGSGPTACFANAVLIGDGSLAPLPWLSAVSGLQGDGVRIGVSALRRAGWSIKIVATDPVRLRETLKRTRHALAGTLPALSCDLRKL